MLVLIFLSLSAESDTIIDFLLLVKLFPLGIRDATISWFYFCLICYSTSISFVNSSPSLLNFENSWTSVLGLLCFFVYTHSFSLFLQSHTFKQDLMWMTTKFIAPFIFIAPLCWTLHLFI